MFPRIVNSKRKYGTYQYLVLSESIRIKGKGSTTRNIANLGNIKKLCKNDINNLIDGLIKLFELEKYGLSDEMEILESLEHGSIIFWRKLWNELGLTKMIRKLLKKHNNKISLPSEKYIEMMVVNRCIDPLSKLGCTRWIDTTCYKIMKDYKKLSLHVENFYRSMDYLLNVKEELEHMLFDRLRNLFSINVKLTFYDITPTFFYSDNCSISDNDHSRDNRPERQQIVVGVVTSWEGYPIKHYVFDGNTKDETTVVEVIKELKTSYNIEETTFVGDRGMITKLNLDNIEDEGYDYIMGVKHRQDEMSMILFTEEKVDYKDYKDYNGLLIQEKQIPVKEFLILKSQKIITDSGIIKGDNNKEQLKSYILNLMNNSEVTYSIFKQLFEGILPKYEIRRKVFNLIKKYEGRYENVVRMIICLNEERKALSKKKRDDKILILSKELNTLFSDKKKKPITVVDQEKKLNEIFAGYKSKYRKYFDIQRDSKSSIGIGYDLNEKILLDSEKNDGVFILCTNRFDLEPSKVVDSYKNLKEVEILFDDLKNFVDIRPVRHWLEQRVRAHVFICILSLLLKRIFEINYRKGKVIMQPLEEVSKSKLVKYKVKYSEREERYKIVPKITTITTLQEKYFKMIGINNPMSLENYVW